VTLTTRREQIIFDANIVSETEAGPEPRGAGIRRLTGREEKQSSKYSFSSQTQIPNRSWTLEFQLPAACSGSLGLGENYIKPI
jgi:hypothetical protein